MAEKLPSAPLVEVIFELRWKLQSLSPDVPKQFWTDPGYFAAVGPFQGEAANLGFPRVRDRPGTDQHVLIAGVVRQQFLRDGDAAFPLFQIGPGIFSINDGQDYDWPAFKARTVKGLASLSKAYGGASGLLAPELIELRYVSSFDADVTGYTDFLRFVNEDTKIRLTMPKKLMKGCGDLTDGNISFQHSIPGIPGTIFSVQMASGQVAAARTVLLITKIVTRGENLLLGRAGLSPKLSGAWLDSAHQVASDFFRGAISSRLLKKFKRPRPA